MSDGAAPPAAEGADESPEDAPWAMQLSVRVERAAPPSTTATCEAAAMAVVRLLADQRARPGGEWEPLVRRWSDGGRIRKVVRRGRGAPFDRALAVPGITVDHAGAQVRAHVPGPTDAVPEPLTKLQVAGLVLDDPDRRLAACGAAVVVIGLTPLVEMSAGKLAAQAGHAAHVAWLDAPAGVRAAWEATGFVVEVVRPDAAGWATMAADAPVAITDAGFTEVPPGTRTSIAAW